MRSSTSQRGEGGEFALVQSIVVLITFSEDIGKTSKMSHMSHFATVDSQGENSIVARRASVSKMSQIWLT